MNITSIKIFQLLLSIETLVIIDVFKCKDITNGVIISHHNIQCDHKVHKLFYQNKIRLSELNLNKRKNIVIPNVHSKIGVIVNASHDGWEEIFDNLNFTTFFKYPYTWIILTKNISTTFNTLSNYPIELDSDLMIISKQDIYYNIFEAYNTGYNLNGVFKLNEIGYWFNSLKIFRSRRTELSGVVLSSTVVVTKQIHNETFKEYMMAARQTQGDSLHKLKFFILLKYMQDMYNISYKLQRTNSWGYYRNGSFDGMVGMLQKGEAEIGGTPVFIRPDRAKFIDYSIPTWQSRPCFIFLHPKHPEGFHTIYTRPLTSLVWYIILTLLFLSAALLCLMFRIKIVNKIGDTEDDSPSLALLSVWCAICQQGMALNRGSVSIRILIFVTFVFSLTIYQYYNAVVVSTLLREMPKNIKTLEDLLKSNLKIGVEDSLYNKDYFKHTTDPVAQELYHKRISNSKMYNFYHADEGMALVKRGDFAFHVDNTEAYPIMKSTFNEREICDASEVVLFPPQYMFAVVRKGSPYKEHVVYAIRKMIESGLLHRLQADWDVPRPACVHTPDSSIFSVSMREFSTALILLVFGMIIAVLIMMTEIIVYQTKKLRKPVRQFRN